MTETQLREQLLATARKMNACGVNQGTSGNLSARIDGGFIVTLTGSSEVRIDFKEQVARLLQVHPVDRGANG